jgi:uncharacterized membrane protein YccC
VIAVAVGVVLALLVATWAPSKELALAIVLPVTLLLGQRRRLGDQCLYAAFAALFMITFGQPEGGYVLSRLAETGLGVIIGTAINLLIFPPVHIRSVRDAAQRAAMAASELLRDIASALTSDWDEQDARDWARRAERLDDRTYELREALRWGRESLRFNPRRRITSKTEPVSTYQPVADRVARAAEPIQTITDALSDASRDRALTPEFTARYSALLESAAAALGTQLTGRATKDNPAQYDPPTADMGELLNDTAQLLAEQHYSLGTPDEEIASSLLLAARQLDQDLNE